jgi:hypothetical protein
MPDIYREKWLMTMVDKLRPYFESLGHPIPAQVAATCGWPSHGALRKRRVIGECWPAIASTNGTVEIFISPSLSDSIEVGATLVHELVHAGIGNEHGHKGPFKRLAVGMGLEGPMRSTRASGVLRERLNALIAEVGPYPHATLNGSLRRGKQDARLLKVECQTCGYTARITRRWIALGLPICPCGSRMVQSWHQQKKGGAAPL